MTEASEIPATPADLAKLHAASFTTPRPWNEAEFASFLSDSACFLITCPHGFLLARQILDEAEILTVAVDPAARRRGLGRALLTDFEQLSSERGVKSVFLEVAADNDAARTLYLSRGFVRTGLRKRYYHAPDGSLKDAELMGKTLT